MFKNGVFFRKKSESGPFIKQTSQSTISFKSKAAKLFGRAWNSLAYGRWFHELPSLKNPDSLFWLLGNSYSLSQKDDFRFDYMARIWISYRENFPELNGHQTDFGWGCTLRSAQMLIAQALMLEKFGKDWLRWDITPSSLANILRLFEDCETAPLGIHSLIAIANKLEFENPVGKWYSPSQAFVLLKNAIERSHSTLLNDIRLLLCIDNCIAKQEIIDSSEEWTKTILLVVPIRLGTDKVNEIYHDHIRTLFQMPYFLGIVGGRPRHAVYFVGYVENTLFQLDPHTCQKYIHLDGQETDEHWETFHSKTIFSMSFKDMDPSCALGFIIKSSEELDRFVDFLTQAGIADNIDSSSSNSIVSIVIERPIYDSNIINTSNNVEDTEFEMM